MSNILVKSKRAIILKITWNGLTVFKSVKRLDQWFLEPTSLDNSSGFGSKYLLTKWFWFLKNVTKSSKIWVHSDLTRQD